MTGQWEKYVQAAADEITYHPGNRTGTPQSRHAVSVMLARAVLAVVGPLIAEDTRDRMVAAAGAALEREVCTGERDAARQAMMDGLIGTAEEQERPSIAEWLRAVR